MDGYAKQPHRVKPSLEDGFTETRPRGEEFNLRDGA